MVLTVVSVGDVVVATIVVVSTAETVLVAIAVAVVVVVSAIVVVAPVVGATVRVLAVGLSVRSAVWRGASHHMEFVIIVVEVEQNFVENTRPVGERLTTFAHIVSGGMAVETKALYCRGSLFAVVPRN